jgi:NitT/TauT family transport system substrate-binding protein
MLFAHRSSPPHVRLALVGAVAAASVAALTACGGGSTKAASGASQKIVIAAGGVGVYNATPYIAQSEGYFASEGLNVTVKQSGSNTLNLVVGGQADVGMIGATAALFPVKSGKDTSLIFANDTSASFAYAATGKPGISSLGQCKRVAAGATGTSTYAMAALLKQSLKASFTIVPFTTPDATMATALSGRTDCIVSNLSLLKPSVDSGRLRLIVDPSKPSTVPPGVPATGPGIGVWGLKAHLAGRHDATVKLVTALGKAIQFIRDHDDAQVAAVLRRSVDFKAIPQAALASQVGVERKFLSGPNGRIPETDWAAYLQFAKMSLPDVDPAAPKWSYRSRVDMSFLDAAASGTHQ